MTDIITTAHDSFMNISNATEISMIDAINGSSSQMEDVVMIVSTIIASVGIVANFTVIVVFLNDKKLRKKIPNIFIIHQVGSTVVQLLPPANEVWGKAMFLHLSVILFTGGCKLHCMLGYTDPGRPP